MFKKLIIISFIFIMASCSKVETIGLKTHNFNSRPKRIVWIQVAGLTEEHFALAKFTRSAVEEKISFENSSCMGKLWNFNLYELRPDATSGFLSQSFGTKNITGQCSDYENEPLWSYLHRIGFKVSVLENGASDKQSLINSWKCNSEKNVIPKVTSLWKMADSSNEKAKRFHFQEEMEFNDGDILYDRSCKAGICYASLYNNAIEMYKNLLTKTVRSMLIVRDFSLESAIARKDIENVRDRINGLEKLYGFFINEVDKKRDVLLVLTGSGGRNIELPRRGKQWEKFDQKGSFVIYKRNSLMSPVLAEGAGSENFCGLYDESEIFKRFLWSPEEKKIPLDLINL
ncbi:hypothetical protein [Halobacteriovorax sp. JY17]|uniref:hypothetical protein n=1 Tax=Halobacteriovorax sp. JY17 TaxID=2014617 RepID=UPI000C4E72E3|nr:hypothetical protein [Halobacteriovorax sp. JY17]PIK14597.1 MAG: hypothetical protein CES88_09670 [Halobacteriovorax sp. JY17]